MNSEGGGNKMSAPPPKLPPRRLPEGRKNDKFREIELMILRLHDRITGLEELLRKDDE